MPSTMFIESISRIWRQREGISITWRAHRNIVLLTAEMKGDVVVVQKLNGYHGVNTKKRLPTISTIGGVKN